MLNLKTFYSIVPINNGYTYLAIDENDMIVKIGKDTKLNTSLIFCDRKKAENFIAQHLEDGECFKVEEIYLNPNYYKEMLNDC